MMGQGFGDEIGKVLVFALVAAVAVTAFFCAGGGVFLGWLIWGGSDQ